MGLGFRVSEGLGYRGSGGSHNKSPQVVVRNVHDYTCILQHAPELAFILIVEYPVFLGPSLLAAGAGVCLRYLTDF